MLFTDFAPSLMISAAGGRARRARDEPSMACRRATCSRERRCTHVAAAPEPLIISARSAPFAMTMYRAAEVEARDFCAPRGVTLTRQIDFKHKRRRYITKITPAMCEPASYRRKKYYMMACKKMRLRYDDAHFSPLFHLPRRFLQEGQVSHHRADKLAARLLKWKI